MKNNIEGYETTFKEASFMLGVYSGSGDNKVRYNGVELAENVMAAIDKRVTTAFLKIKDTWDITQEGRQIIYTAKEKKAYEGDALEIEIQARTNQDDYPIWNNKVTTVQKGREANPGQNQENIITIGGEAKSKGILEVTLSVDSLDITKEINIEKDYSNEKIASLIAEAFSDLSYWDIISEEDSKEIYLVAKEASINKDMTVNIINK